jgi:putative peptidoglycan lipid II flippase
MNLLKAASTVSLLTLLSRVTGLIREVLTASVFGAGAMADAFNVAFRIPNLLRRLFAEGAFSQAFVPLIARTREQEGDEATKALIDAVATVLFWALLLTSVLGVVLAPLWVWAMAAGLQEFDTAVALTRIMFPYIACMSMVALCAGILNTWKKFAVPAATPVLLNLSFIAAALWGVPWFESMGLKPIEALAWGVMAGGVLQLGVQWPALRAMGMWPRLRVSVSGLRQSAGHPGVGRMLALMGPAVLGVSVAQLSLLINTQIASHVGVGAVSWLSYADRLMEFPMGMLGVALGVVLIPQLSAAQARGDSQAYSAMLDWGLRLLLLLALPCAAALLVFAEPLVAVLYHRNAFTDTDVHQTVKALMGYGVGLLGLLAVKVLAPGYYARQDIRTPVKIAVLSLVLTQALNLALVPLLGHAGLALSIGLAAMANAGLLLAGLLRSSAYRPAPAWGRFGARVILATAVVSVFMQQGSARLDWLALGQTEALRVLALAGLCATVVLVYFATLRLLGLRLRDFMRRG